MKIEWEDNSDIGPPMVQLLLEADGVDVDIQDIGDCGPLVWVILSAFYLIQASEMVDMYGTSFKTYSNWDKCIVVFSNFVGRNSK